MAVNDATCHSESPCDNVCVMEANTEDSWADRLTRQIGANVRKARLERDMSVQELAKRCTDSGYRVIRTSLVNLETGTRKSITVPELIALGRALDVAPLALVFPPSSTEMTEYTADSNVSTWGAWRLFTDPLVPAVTSAGDQKGSLSEDEYAVFDYVAFERAAGAWRRAQYYLQQPWVTDKVRAAHEEDLERFITLGDTALKELEAEHFNLADLNGEFLAAVRRRRASQGDDDA